MKRLKITSLYDNFHFVIIFLILLVLSLKYWYLFSLLFIYSIFIYKKTDIFFIVVLFGIILLMSFVIHLPNNNLKELEGVVIKCDDKSAVVISNFKKYFVYHDDIFVLGDKVKLNVESIKYQNELFDYNEYLQNQGIFGPYQIKKYKIIGNKFVLSKINNFCISKMNQHPSIYKGYINSLIFANSDEIADIKDSTAKIGVSHILAVSGMHISFLILILDFILKKIFYFEKPIDICIIIFLFLYIIITNFSLTVLRAALMVCLSKIFKMNKLYFTKLDVLSIVGIFLFIINPNTLFLLSFQLSFLVSFIIIIFTSNFEIKNKIINMYFMGLITFLVGLPLIININYEFNILSLLLGPLFILYFELLLFPVTIIMFISPITYRLFDPIYSFFAYFTTHLSNFNCNIIVGSLNIVIILIYYVILFFLFSSFELKRFRKYSVSIFLMFLFLIYNKNSFNQFLQIKFYSVGQGDSAVIILPKGEGYILVDCYNNVLDYLKRDGIRKIDIIFLSHSDNDHIGSLDLVLNEFEIDKIYTSIFDMKNYPKEYIIEGLKSNDIIAFKTISFYIYGPIRDYGSKNNNSLVFKMKSENISCLFTGDIEKEAEEELANKYKCDLSSNILKVAHHGSNTSSTKKFLEYVRPKYYVISVGLNNIYNFPNNHYLLKKENIYRTDIDGTVTFTYRKKLKIKTVYR